MTDFAQSPSQVHVTMMLADSAQVADNKLFILGGGISVIPSTPAPLAIAVKIEIPWDRADVTHEWSLELLDADGMQVMVNELPVLVQGQFQIGRGENVLPGSPLPMPLAVNFSGLGLPAGQRFAWRLVIDGDTEPHWQLAFSVAEAPIIEI